FLDPQRFYQLARLEPGHLAERAPQRRLGGMESDCERPEADAFFTGVRNLSHGALHQPNGPGDFVGAAAQARTVTVLLSLFSRVEENHVAPQRPPRRTRRPAVNVRRAHGEYERSV